MKKVFLVLIQILACSLLFAEGARFTGHAGISNLSGTTNYDINFYEPNPYTGRIDYESKLEFDLNTTLLNVGIEMGLLDDKLIFNGTYSASMTENGGNMRDRDWASNDYINSYYDELMGDTNSDVDSKLKMYDFSAEWRFVELGRNVKIKLKTILGYNRQQWGTFAAKNLEGYYSGLFSATGYREYVNDSYYSDILTYEVTYDMYYTGFGADFKFTDNLCLKTLVKVGYVDAKDKDDHILRQKISTGKTDGSMAALNLNLDYRLTSHFTISVFTEVTAIATKGKQTQYYYDENHNLTDFIAEIDDKITSAQVNTGFKVGFDF
jgi:hypothetical protein